jgi:hypothetical protein
MHISFFLFVGLFVPFLLHGYVIVKRRAQLESAVFNGQLSEVKGDTPLLESPGGVRTIQLQIDDGTLTHASQPSSSQHNTDFEAKTR